jgi:hypothetical protein
MIVIRIPKYLPSYFGNKEFLKQAIKEKFLEKGIILDFTDQRKTRFKANKVKTKKR